MLNPVTKVVRNSVRSRLQVLVGMARRMSNLSAGQCSGRLECPDHRALLLEVVVVRCSFVVNVVGGEWNGQRVKVVEG